MKKIVIANWKMNGDQDLVRNFIRRFGANLNASGEKTGDVKSEIVVCPPAPLITYFNELRDHSAFFVGAQDCFWKDCGAFTGEISPKLLKEIGCKYVILGHSERRTILAETDDMIYEKWKAAVSCGLTPVLCIGEKAEERKKWREILEKQLLQYQKEADLHGTIFAYEPVWSIGTGQIPTVAEIEEVALFVRKVLREQPDFRVVYGGSVKADNASEIMKADGLDGVLVGSASLNVDEFAGIVDVAN